MRQAKIGEAGQLKRGRRPRHDGIERGFVSGLCQTVDEGLEDAMHLRPPFRPEPDVHDCHPESDHLRPSNVGGRQRAIDEECT